MVRRLNFLPIGLLALVAAFATAEQERARGPSILTGTVVNAAGAPVTAATIRRSSPIGEAATRTDTDGRFRFEPIPAGTHNLRVSAPGYLDDRFRLTLAAGQSLALPPIELTPAVSIRVRVLSPDGEPIDSPRIVTESYNVDGSRISEVAGEAQTERRDADGAILIGPLPRGIAELAVDTPPHARMRLPPVRITGSGRIVDADVVRLEPGSALHVDVVDRAGKPVAGQFVYLDDRVSFSPVPRGPVTTDPRGRATFDRLASGRYRIRVRALRPCGTVHPTVMRWLTVPGAGAVQRRLLADGVELALQLTQAGAPLVSAEVSIAPDAPEPGLPRWLRHEDAQFFRRPVVGPGGGAACGAMSDRSGRAIISGVPAGQARAAVRVGNSTWIRRIDIPPQGGQATLDVPLGTAPLRVVSSTDGTPVPGAALMWDGNGARVEARSSATGDAVLDGIGEGPAQLSVRAPGFAALETQLVGPLMEWREIELERTALTSLRCRVVTETGGPAADAVVIVRPEDLLEPAHVAATDIAGEVSFSMLPRGPARIVVHAPGHLPSSVNQSIPATADLLTISLKRPAGNPPIDR